MTRHEWDMQGTADSLAVVLKTQVEELFQPNIEGTNDAKEPLFISKNLNAHHLCVLMLIYHVLLNDNPYSGRYAHRRLWTVWGMLN
jgi:hypothetical protein